MIRFERSLQMDATPEQVWAVMGRFMHIDAFAPEIARVEALTEEVDGVGASRRCHFVKGGALVETVTNWEDGRSYRVALSEFGAIPMKQAFADLRIEPRGGAARVVWAMEYQMKMGPLGWLMGQTMVRRSIGKVIDVNLEALAARVASAPKVVGNVA